MPQGNQQPGAQWKQGQTQAGTQRNEVLGVRTGQSRTAGAAGIDATSLLLVVKRGGGVGRPTTYTPPSRSKGAPGAACQGSRRPNRGALKPRERHEGTRKRTQPPPLVARGDPTVEGQDAPGRGGSGGGAAPAAASGRQVRTIVERKERTEGCGAAKQTREKGSVRWVIRGVRCGVGCGMRVTRGPATAGDKAEAAERGGSRAVAAVEDAGRRRVWNRPAHVTRLYDLQGMRVSLKRFICPTLRFSFFTRKRGIHGNEGGRGSRHLVDMQ